jgi:NitT/TauT family transport system substrate-binding protein
MRVRYTRTLMGLTSLGCVTLMLVSGCSTSSSNPAPKLEKTNLVVGAVESVSQAALFIAQQRGIFAAHGLRVKIDPITSTSGVVPQLENGTYDVAAGQVTTFVADQAKGVGQFRVLAAGLQIGEETEQLVIPQGSSITSPAQLAGKVIGVNAPSGDGELLTDETLSVYNITPQQVTYKVVPFPKMGAALAAHQMDATFCSEPYCTEMEQNYGDTELASLDVGAVQGWLISGYATTAAWEKKYPNTAAAFAASIVQAANLADTSQTTIEQALQASLGLSQQIVGVMGTGSYPTAVAQDQLQQLASAMTQFGELSPQANVTATVNALSADP